MYCVMKIKKCSSETETLNAPESSVFAFKTSDSFRMVRLKSCRYSQLAFGRQRYEIPAKLIRYRHFFEDLRDSNLLFVTCILTPNFYLSARFVNFHCNCINLAFLLSIMLYRVFYYFFILCVVSIILYI